MPRNLDDCTTGPERDGVEKDPFLSRFSLDHPAIKATLWTGISYGVGQMLRLGSNLVLTRLLAPEAFGLMVIVNVILTGLNMFSDFGLGPSIIQNPRGEEPAFLRTAWTVQIVRGAIIWAAALLFAWPLSRFYGEPILLLLIPAMATQALVDAFTSTQVGALERRLELPRVILLDLSCYAFAIGVAVLIALVWPSVWAMVIGGLVYSTLSMVLTHLVLGGPRMAFTIDRGMAREMIHFGKWLFVSSAFAFLYGQLDRIVLGKFMSMAELGVYSIAFMFSQLVVQLVGELSRSILFPVYARAAEQSPKELRRQTIRFRLLLMALSLPPLWFLVVLGPELVELLYDDRYLGAGWVLQLLAAAAIARTLFGPIDMVLMASGDSFRHMILQCCRSVLLVVLMAAGGYWHGTTGLIYGFAASALLQYPLIIALIRKYRVWFPLFDAAGLAIAAAGIVVAFWLKGFILPA